MKKNILLLVLNCTPAFVLCSQEPIDNSSSESLKKSIVIKAAARNTHTNSGSSPVGAENLFPGQSTAISIHNLPINPHDDTIQNSHNEHLY